MAEPHVDPAMMDATVHSLTETQDAMAVGLERLRVLRRRLSPRSRKRPLDKDVLAELDSILAQLEYGAAALGCVRPALEELVDEGLRLRYILRRYAAEVERDEPDHPAFPPGWFSSRPAKR